MTFVRRRHWRSVYYTLYWVLFAELEHLSIATGKSYFTILESSAMRSSMTIDSEIVYVSRACVTITFFFSCDESLCHIAYSKNIDSQNNETITIKKIDMPANTFRLIQIFSPPN